MSAEVDKVVRELDVFVSTSPDEEGHQVHLLQYPLRPAWRPYNVEDLNQVAMKPKARKLRMKTHLDTGGSNYNQNAKATSRLESLILDSSVATPPAPLAAAVITDNQVVLLPIQASWQMRPKMDHLCEAPSTSASKEKMQPSDPDDSLVLVHTNVRKRETDRQKELRLASYAHLQAEEAKEDWKPLLFHHAEGEEAEDMRRLLADATCLQQAVGMDMAHDDYLDALLPCKLQEPQKPGPQLLTQAAGAGKPQGQVLAAGAAPAGLPPPSQGAPAPAAQPTATLQAQVLAALPKALGALFSLHSTASLDNIRQWLVEENVGAAKDAAGAPDDALHQAVLGCDGILCIRSTYLPRQTGQHQEFRDLLLSLLSMQTGVKRAEIMSAARGRNIELSESDYTRHMLKVMKELCTSSGSNWHLRPGW